jgi:uncharacterized protein involved in exopolysaccharide biosynthesis
MIRTGVGPELTAIDLARYVRSRRRFLAIACVSAVLLAGVASMLLPKRYTATATLVVEPPAGMDPRSATALSPVYLESLKTYESLVSSDSLFLKALDHLGIRERFPSRSVESLKRSVLRVSKPVNTRVIEISATLDDPRAAQQLAAYIAEQASLLNKTIDERSAAGTATEAEMAYGRAEERLRMQRKASDEFVSAAAGLDVELSNLAELKYSVDRDRGEAKAELAGSGTTADPAASRARIAELDRQSADLTKQIESTGERLDRFRQRQDSLDAELKAARGSFEAARLKLDDLKSSAGFRGERLEVLDAGIVPQHPSFPNTPLNVVIALAISLIASLVYLAIGFGFERAQRQADRDRGLW